MDNKQLWRPLGEHRVWKEGEYYIKVPIKKRLFHDKSRSAITQSRKNIRYINKQFSKWLSVPPTRVIPDAMYGYRIIQKAVSWTPVNVLEIQKNKALMIKLQEMFDYNYQLRKKTKQWVDFYGTDAFFAPHILHNLLIDQHDTLRLIDIGVLRGNAKNNFFYGISHIMFHAQNSLFRSTCHYISPIFLLLQDRVRSLIIPHATNQNSVQDSTNASHQKQ